MCPTECTDLPAPDGGFLVAYSTCDEARAVLQARGDDWIQQHSGSNEGSPFDHNGCTASGVPFTGAESCCGCNRMMEGKPPSAAWSRCGTHAIRLSTHR
jgi:hypothetical protein